MEKLRSEVTQIAYTDTHKFLSLPPLRLSLLPLLSLASSLYTISLFIRRGLYSIGLFHPTRLPVPVISVGNLTWGGNGKTPMVELIALELHKAGILPLVLTRGYAGGDEARMLQEHLRKTSAKVGVGANRAAVATSFFQKMGGSFDEGIVGAVILDDGMQHWRLHRDLEIVMVNGMAPWGNKWLLPLGPLREPFSAFKRADLAVIHHADMVYPRQLKAIESTISEVKKGLPIFYSRLRPSHFFEVKNSNFTLPLSAVGNKVILCVSAIGFPDSLIQVVEKIGPLHVDRLDFGDHHRFQDQVALIRTGKTNIISSPVFGALVESLLVVGESPSLYKILHWRKKSEDDIDAIEKRLTKLNNQFGLKPIVVLTEKDYYRDPDILKLLDKYKVLVLCSSLQILPFEGQAEDSFNMLLRRIFKC